MQLYYRFNWQQLLNFWVSCFQSLKSNVSSFYGRESLAWFLFPRKCKVRYEVGIRQIKVSAWFFLKHESNISYLNSTTFPRHIFHITLTKRFDAQISVFISQFLRHCKLEQILANDLKMRKKNNINFKCYLFWE